MALTFMLAAVTGAEGVTIYVSKITNKPSAPYTTRSTAATNINDALQNAASGDIILIIDSYRAYQGFSLMAWGDLCNNWWQEANNIRIEAETGRDPAVSKTGCYTIGIFVAQKSGIRIRGIDVINTTAGGPGVQMQNAVSCTLENCVISNNSSLGVYIKRDGAVGPSSGVMIRNCKVANNGNVGMKMECRNSVITNCLITRNAYQGIYFGEGCTNVRIMNTKVRKHIQNGIELSSWGAHYNNTIRDSTVSSNSIGVWLGASTLARNNSIINSTISSNTNLGIKLDNANNNRIVNCNINKNKLGGIYFGLSSTNNKILRSVIAKNGFNEYHDGIEISSWGNHTRNLIQECQVYSNAGKGIFVNYNAGEGGLIPRNNAIFKCLVYRNGRSPVTKSDGINLENTSQNTRVEYCTVFDNGNNGVALDSDDTLKNCIVASNDAYGVWGNNTPAVSYCCLYGNTSGNGNGITMSGCLIDDPLFKATAANLENFHLRHNSPCQNTAEPNRGQQASMGRYTACVVPSSSFVSNAAAHNIIWASSLSNILYKAGDTVMVNYRRISGASSDFRLVNVTRATSDTSWRTEFSSETANEAGQWMRAVVNNSIYTMGRAENIAFAMVTNGRWSTNYAVIRVTNSGAEYEGPIIANDFLIYSLGNTPIHYVSYYTNTPIVRAAFPYATPQTASIDIQTIMNSIAFDAGDRIHIIDNYQKYDGFTMDSSKPNNVTVCGAFGYSPAVSNSQQPSRCGAYVSGPDNIMISNIIFKNNAADGIHLINSANTKIESNRICFNSNSGIGVRNCPGLRVLRNRIWNNGSVFVRSFNSASGGIYFWTNTASPAVIRNNSVFSNPMNIKVLYDPTSFTLQNNSCHDCQNNPGFNILMVGGKKNVLRDNQCFDAWFSSPNIKFVWSNSNLIQRNLMKTADSGIRFESGMYNIVSRNTIRSNGLGVFMYKAGEAFAPYSTNNYILSNQFQFGSYGVYIERGPRTVIKSNVFNRCTNGIYIGTTFADGGAGAVVKSNLLKNCGGSAILMYWGKDSVIENNLIYSNGMNDYTAGIEFALANNNTRIRYNTIIYNSNNGIVLQGTNNRVINNNIYGNPSRGIKINPFSVNNTLASNRISLGLYGVVFEENTFRNTLLTNVLKRNTLYGLYLSSGTGRSSTNRFVSCLIYSNKTGISFLGSMNNTVSNCQVSFNTNEGIKIDNGRWNKIKNCAFRNNRFEGIYLGQGCTNTLISGCLIRENKLDGIDFSYWGNHNRNQVTACSIISNQQQGITLGGGGFSNYFAFNHIVSNREQGLFIYNSSYNTVFSNDIRRNLLPGIRITNARGNLVRKNSVSFNSEGIRLLANTYSNTVFSNAVFNSSGNGIYLGDSRNNRVSMNQVRNSGNTGLRFSRSHRNRITGNHALTNTAAHGFLFELSAGTNYCASNIIAYNRIGLMMSNATVSTLFRNALFRNTYDGIRLSSASVNNRLANNSLCSNGVSAGHGISLYGLSTGNILKNSIVAFNRNGYGVNLVSGGLTITYCDVFSNASGAYSGVAPSTGCISRDPLWLSYAIYSTNFLYITSLSPCLDTGDPADPVPPYGGPVIDMGWKEHTRPYVNLSISKSISNVRLGGVNQTLIPGTTIQYRIELSLSGNVNGTNIVIYDPLSPYVRYQTNYMGTATLWTAQYATNANPSQAFDSADYRNTFPSKDRVRWVRWKKPGQSNTFGVKTIFFRVILR